MPNREKELLKLEASLDLAESEEESVFLDDIAEELEADSKEEHIRVFLKDGIETNPFYKDNIKRAIANGEIPKNTKLNRNKYKSILKALLTGSDKLTVCQFTNIHPRTFASWYNQGEEDYVDWENGVKERESIFARFYCMVNYATSAPEIRLAHVVMKGAKKDARFAYEILKNRNTYWNKQRVDIFKTETNETTINVEINEQNSLRRKDRLTSILKAAGDRRVDNPAEDGEFRELPEPNPPTKE